MNNNAILENAAGGLISIIVWSSVTLITSHIAYRYFTSVQVSRYRIYRKILIKKLQIHFWHHAWWKILAFFNRSEVHNTLDDPNISVLEEWLFLRGALLKIGFPPLEISGSEFYQSIKTEMRKYKNLRDEAKLIGDQAAEANKDPRFVNSTISFKWLKETEQFGLRYPEYYKTVTNKLKLLDEEKKNPDWKTAEFCVAAASISLSRNGSEIIAGVVIPENPFIAWTKEMRECIERGPSNYWPAKNEMEQFKRNENPKMSAALMRFSAGGSLTILKALKEGVTNIENNHPLSFGEEDYKEYIVIGQKDSRANIHPNCLVPSSGMAEEEEDWKNPLLIVVSECVEEIRFRCKDDDSWFFPFFSKENDSSQFNEHVMASIESHRRNLKIYEEDSIWNSEIQNRPKENVGDLIQCKSELLSIGDDSLIINGAEVNNKNLFVLDAEFGAIDIMAAVRIQIQKPLSQLRVLDGESICDRSKSKMKLLWRNVFVFTPEELSNVFAGKESRAEAFFGRDCSGNWKDGVPVNLSACPWINPPLWGAGPALLKKIYGIEVDLFDATLAQKPIITF